MNIDKLEKRMDNIESTLETIRDNHLAHIDRYLKYTLVGVILSTIASATAVWISL